MRQGNGKERIDGDDKRWGRRWKEEKDVRRSIANPRHYQLALEWSLRGMEMEMGTVGLSLVGMGEDPWFFCWSVRVENRLVS